MNGKAKIGTLLVVLAFLIGTLAVATPVGADGSRVVDAFVSEVQVSDGAPDIGQNITITATPTVFFVSRKIVEAKTAVIARVPRCRVAIKNTAPTRSQYNPSSRKKVDDFMPPAMKTVIKPMRMRMKAYTKKILPMRYPSLEMGFESVRSMVWFSTSLGTKLLAM